MEFCDTDTNVRSFVKVNENYHSFARISYIRVDGLLAAYCPDFIVAAGGKIFIVETKAQDNLSQENVRLKQLATVDWINRINQLKPEDRGNAEWEYVLLGERTFYGLSSKGASILEVFEYSKITKNKIEGVLF